MIVAIPGCLLHLCYRFCNSGDCVDIVAALYTVKTGLMGKGTIVQ